MSMTIPEYIVISVEKFNQIFINKATDGERIYYYTTRTIEVKDINIDLKQYIWFDKISNTSIINNFHIAKFVPKVFQ